MVEATKQSSDYQASRARVPLDWSASTVEVLTSVPLRSAIWCKATPDEVVPYCTR